MMTDSPYRFTVFTKPWKIPLPELGRKVHEWGFDGIELPVRPGYPVNPENVAVELPKAARLLKDRFGLTIESVAGPIDEKAIAACGAAGVPVIRICPNLAKGEKYGDGETRWRRAFDEAVPHLEKHGVAIGIQNHSGRYVPVHAMGLSRLLAPYDPKHICAVWDAAHNALEGESEDLALDIIGGPYLRMVNLKNAIRRRKPDNDGAVSASWQTYWTAGRDGFASWPRVAGELKQRNWTGVVCLCAEYSEEDDVERLITDDLRFARPLFERTEAGAS